MQRTKTIKLIKICIIILILVTIGGYATWRSLDYARGPRITIIEPLDGSVIMASTTTIVAHVERVKDVTLNGKSVSIDENGTLHEILIIFPGMNIITLTAHDQFNRDVRIQIRIVGM